MRDPARIERITDALNILWCRYPDMRLGQLIGNLAAGQDGFFMEDDAMEQRIRSVTEHGFD